MAPSGTLTKKALLYGGLAISVMRMMIIPGDTVVTAANLTDEQRFTEIREILGNAPSGQAALELRDGLQVQVSFESGNGSYFDYETRGVVLDSALPSETAALTFVHEMVHAQAYHEGRTPDIFTLTKDEYVNARLMEEAEAETKSVVVKLELVEACMNVSEARLPFEDRFHRSYTVTVRNAQLVDRQASQAELASVGRQAAEDDLFRAFRYGVARRSIDGETYPAFEAKYYDELHSHLAGPQVSRKIIDQKAGQFPLSSI